MDALSRWVATFFLNSLWQVTLVAGAATVADLGLRRAPARYRHALWALALAAAAVLPLASLKTLVKRSPAPVTVGIGVSRSIPALVPLPMAPPVKPAKVNQLRAFEAWHRFLAEADRGLSVPPLVARVILMLYLSFLAVSLIRFGRACLSTRVTRRRAFAEPLPAHMVATLERCHQSMRRWRRIGDIAPKVPSVRVWWSREISGPATVGARHRAIILPLSLRDPERVDDLTAALAHESAHVVRHDYFSNLVLELLSLPIAFHPLTLLMKRRLGEARELACDELAARVLDPSDYARSLVRLADQIQRRAVAASFDYTLGVFDANILEERVMRLLMPRASGRLAKTFFLLSVLVITAICLASARFSVGVARAETRPSSPASMQDDPRSGESLASFVGTWKGEFKGKTFVLLKLGPEDQQFAGTISMGEINLDDAGNVSEVTEEAGAPVDIFDTKTEAGRLYFKQKDGAATMSYEMRLDDAEQAQLKILGDSGPTVQPFKLVKETGSSPSAAVVPSAAAPIGQSQDQSQANDSAKTNAAAPSPDRAVKSYQVGVIGGIMKTNGVSGIVVDPSGARVPNANVVLINRQTQARQEVKADATGNFEFKDLPAGRYALEVTSQGMSEALRMFELKASGPAPFIPFVLEPGILTESVVVTAKAPEGISTNGATAVGPRRIRVGGNVEAAKLIDNPAPEYPESARAAGIQGVVLLEGVISIEGVPMSLKVLSSPSDDLSQAATDAVSQWRYRSTLLNGEPVEVLTTIAVAFRLEK